MKPQIYTSDLDNRYGSGEIVSRIGLKAKSNTFNTKTDIYKDILNKNDDSVDCVLVDEAQFLTESQVEQLGRIVDELNIPVLAFGIRTDFQAPIFLFKDKNVIIQLSNSFVRQYSIDTVITGTVFQPIQMF